LVTGQKAIENQEVYANARHNLLRSGSAFGLFRRLDIAANEPTGKPPRRDLLHWSKGLAYECSRNRGQIEFVANAKMLQALPDTPRTRDDLPVQLIGAECSNEIPGTPISCIEVADQSL